MEKFQEVKEATKNAMKSANGSNAVTPTTSANTSPISGRAVGAMQNDNTAIDPHTVEPPNMSNTNTQNANPDSPSHKLLNTCDIKQEIGSATPSPQPAMVATAGSGGVTGGGGGGGGGGITISSGGSIVGMHTGPGAGATAEQQLKYENERLKMALAQR